MCPEYSFKSGVGAADKQQNREERTQKKKDLNRK